MSSEIKKRFDEHQDWLDDQLDSIKEDMGYKAQEEFDQDYKTLCPITLVDFISLEKSIYNELDEVEKYHKEKNIPISISHIKESLRLGPLGFFAEALEDRRDKFKEVLYPRGKIKEIKKEEDEYFTNSFGIRMKKQKGYADEKNIKKEKEKESLHKGKVNVL